MLPKVRDIKMHMMPRTGEGTVPSISIGIRVKAVVFGFGMGKREATRSVYDSYVK